MKNSNLQLPIDIPSRRSPLDKLLRLFKTASKEDQVLTSFWTSQPAIYAIISSLLVNIGLVAFGVINYNELPPQMRFLYNPRTDSVTSAPTNIVVFSPAIVLIIEIVIIRLLYSVFTFDKRLSFTVSLLLVLINFIVLVTGTQIYSLSL